MANNVNNTFEINFSSTATTTTVHKTDPSNEELVSATNGEKEGKKLPENDGEMEITNYTANGTSSNSKEEDEEGKERKEDEDHFDTDADANTDADADAAYIVVVPEGKEEEEDKNNNKNRTKNCKALR